MKKIGVIGSINMDMTVETERIPGKGETLSGKNLTYNPGGKGANQAVAAARLGADVTMFGCVGQDDFGENLIKNLQNCGIHTQYIGRIPKVPTGLALITIAESDNVIVVIPGANHCVTKEYLDGVKEQILACDILILQNEIPLETVWYAMELCHEAGKYVIYNPAPAEKMPEGIMEWIDCMTPNEHEAALLFPEYSDLSQMFQQYGQKLVITVGKDGVRSVDEKGTSLCIPAYPVNVVDTTGAGDTFNGGFAYGLASGMKFDEALVFANAAAGLSVQSLGAQGGMPNAGQVREFLRQN